MILKFTDDYELETCKIHIYLWFGCVTLNFTIQSTGKVLDHGPIRRHKTFTGFPCVIRDDNDNEDGQIIYLMF